jgi:[ribosomal protein S5]-alanine N-acetyltransferase
MPHNDTARGRTLAPADPVRVEAPAADGLTIRTRRMFLRPLEPGDQPALLAAANASRSSLDLSFPLWRPDESDGAMFARQLELARPAAAANFRSAPFLRLVAVLADGTIAGGFHINAIVRGLEGTADINWWIASPHAGRGLATEGLEAILRFALGDLPAGLGLQRASASITRDNCASARVAEKAGMVRAGEEKSYLSTGDRWVLHDLYTRSAADIPL